MREGGTILYYKYAVEMYEIMRNKRSEKNYLADSSGVSAVRTGG